MFPRLPFSNKEEGRRASEPTQDKNSAARRHTGGGGQTSVESSRHGPLAQTSRTQIAVGNASPLGGLGGISQKPSRGAEPGHRPCDQEESTSCGHHPRYSYPGGQTPSDWDRGKSGATSSHKHSDHWFHFWRACNSETSLKTSQPSKSGVHSDRSRAGCQAPCVMRKGRVQPESSPDHCDSSEGSLCYLADEESSEKVEQPHRRAASQRRSRPRHHHDPGRCRRSASTDITEMEMGPRKKPSPPQKSYPLPSDPLPQERNVARQPFLTHPQLQSCPGQMSSPRAGPRLPRRANPHDSDSLTMGNPTTTTATCSPSSSTLEPTTPVSSCDDCMRNVQRRPLYRAVPPSPVPSSGTGTVTSLNYAPDAPYPAVRGSRLAPQEAMVLEICKSPVRSDLSAVGSPHATSAAPSSSVSSRRVGREGVSGISDGAEQSALSPTSPPTDRTSNALSGEEDTESPVKILDARQDYCTLFLAKKGVGVDLCKAHGDVCIDLCEGEDDVVTDEAFTVIADSALGGQELQPAGAGVLGATCDFDPLPPTTDPPRYDSNDSASVSPSAKWKAIPYPPEADVATKARANQATSDCVIGAVEQIGASDVECLEDDPDLACRSHPDGCSDSGGEAGKEVPRPGTLTRGRSLRGVPNAKADANESAWTSSAESLSPGGEGKASKENLPPAPTNSIMRHQSRHDTDSGSDPVPSGSHGTPRKVTMEGQVQYFQPSDLLTWETPSHSSRSSESDSGPRNARESVLTEVSTVSSMDPDFLERVRQHEMVPYQQHPHSQPYSPLAASRKDSAMHSKSRRGSRHGRRLSYPIPSGDTATGWSPESDKGADPLHENSEDESEVSSLICCCYRGRRDERVNHAEERLSNSGK